MSIKGFSVNGVVQRYDYTALDNLPQGQGVSDDLKAALLQLAQKVAYIDDQGQTYYDDLYDALYPEKTLLSITANFQQGQAVVYNTDSLDSLKQYLTVTAAYDDGSTETVPSSAYTLSGTLTTGTSVITVTYEGKTDAFNVVVTAAPIALTVTNNLTGCTTSNSATSVLENTSYTAVITASSGYTLVGATVSITMGGQDITTSAYSGGIITINNVAGALVISVAAVERVLSSITAVYTQSGTVYDTDTLDSLKTDLVVTAHYSDSSTATVASEDYTLSGDLTHEQTIVDLLDGATWTDGIAFDDNGNQLDRPTLACSDYLPVTPGTLYTYSKPVSGGTDAYGMGFYLYDSNKGWLGREASAGTQSGTKYVKTYTPASNVAYVRLMAYVTAKSGAEFTYDATPSSWTSTITVAYGGKTTTFDVTVTRATELFTDAVLVSHTTGGTVTFNLDGSVRMQTTGSTTSWGLSFTPNGSASDFASYDLLKGHTIRCVYSIQWGAMTANSFFSMPYILTKALSSNNPTRLRYSSDALHNSESEDGYVDFVVPMYADNWAAGTGDATGSYLSYQAYLYSSTAGADVTVRLKFYDLGIL